MSSTNRNVSDAEIAIEKILLENNELKLNSADKQEIKNNLLELKEMLAKIQSGTVEIAVYGEVSSGKSSLLNTLLGEKRFKEGAAAGVTTTKEKAQWAIGTDDYKVVFVDTPGICEVDGQERAKIAEDAVRFADFVMFIIDEDIKAHEFEAIKSLHELHKPVLVIFNKIDTHSTTQREEIAVSVLKKLEGIIPAENFIPVSANPIEREYIIEKADGTTVSEIRKPRPIVETLQQRILEILEEEGKAIIALNATLFASDVSDKVNLEKIRIKDKEAQMLVKKYATVKALAVCLNPVPLADIIGGMSLDVLMVFHLSKVYDIEMTRIGSLKLIEEIGTAAGILSSVELIQHAVVNSLKLFSIGSAIIITAIPQGIVVAYLTTVYGQVAKEYFKNGCSWGSDGPKAVIRKILTEQSSVTKSILEEIKDGIFDKIGEKDKTKEIT